MNIILGLHMRHCICTLNDRPVMSIIGIQHSLLAMQSFIMTSNPCNVKVLDTRSHEGASEHCLYTLLCPLTFDRYSAILGPPLKDLLFNRLSCSSFPAV